MHGNAKPPEAKDRYTGFLPSGCISDKVLEAKSLVARANAARYERSLPQRTFGELRTGKDPNPFSRGVDSCPCRPKWDAPLPAASPSLRGPEGLSAAGPPEG